MSDYTRPVPPSLAKKGIKRITDNLQPGEQPDWVKHFFWVFRPELEARFMKPMPVAPASEKTK